MGNFALSCSAQFECESAHTCKTGPSQVHHSADSGIGMSIVSFLLCISTSSRVLRLTKSWSKYFFGANFNVSPQGVSQLWSLTWNHWKRSKMNQKGWKWPPKKYFDQLLSAHSTQKLVKIHNTCLYFYFNSKFQVLMHRRTLWPRRSMQSWTGPSASTLSCPSRWTEVLSSQQDRMWRH